MGAGRIAGVTGGTRKPPLFLLYAAITVATAVVAFAVFTAWSYNQQADQAERQLVAEARVLQMSVDATWDFIDNMQYLINYDSQGRYEFKGLYCSMVGKSVGMLFSASTGHQYELGYVRTDPRNVLDAPDQFEARALALFGSGEADESYEVVEGEGGTRMFRYASAIFLSESCLECHGSPAGELDVTGYPKEGLGVGDLAGAVSISMPMDLYDQAMEESAARSATLFAALLACLLLLGFFLVRHLVVTPLEAVEHSLEAVTGGREGRAELDGVGLTREMENLACGVRRMSAELDELHGELEGKVEERTRELQEANALLQRQREEISIAYGLLEEANSKLSDENEYRATIMSILSHELRTPLTAIISYVGLWETEGPQGEGSMEYVEKIKAHSKTLLDMVNNVLDIARLESGKVEYERSVVDPSDLAGSVVDVLGPLAESGRVDLSYEVGVDVPLFFGDFEQLVRVLLNLAGNAVKFTPEGGRVSVEIGCRVDEPALWQPHPDGSGAGVFNVSDESHRAEVPAVDGAGGVHVMTFSVQDNGIGIEPEMIEGIFDRFVQVDNGISRKYRGTGLGLTLVKKTVECMGGRVSVESKPGEGSTFLVELPVEVVDMGIDEGWEMP